MSSLPSPSSSDTASVPHAGPSRSPLHASAPHESGLKHTSGEAIYVDDLPAPRDLVTGHIVTSPHAHARLGRVDASRARALPGVLAVLFAQDIPGHNQVGPVIHDEPLLAEGEVHFVGQSVALVLAESADVARRAAALVEVEYTPLPAILSIQAAVQAGSFLSDPHTIRQGDPEAALAAAPVRVSGECMTGAQDHFYLETQASLAVPGEDGAVHLWCSTQHPTEVQTLVAEVLGIGRHLVVVEVPRMGGGFGGKETQAAPFACLAALGTRATGRPVKVWLNRDQDMASTGKRHPFWGRYDAGLDETGRLLALKVELVSDGGWSTDLSRAILDRALFHLDNAYFVPALQFTGRVARTNLPSNTAFRGFGGPQGMFVMEEMLNHAAERLGMDPAVLRERNYYGEAPRDTTPYGQPVVGNRLPRIHAELLASSDYARRRAEIETFNAASRWTKRGIGLQPVKFGISFTTSFLNQAGALVMLYTDGSVQLNHGGTEMGQGLHTKMRALCAHELGVPPERVRVMHTATDKVPNTSATAASSGSDLNGQAVKQACEVLRERLAPVALGLLKLDARNESLARGVVFAGGEVSHPARPERTLRFAEVVHTAYLAQLSLSATGYYRTPDITYDRDTGRGKPFHYYAFGAAVVEVELSGLTGEHRVRRVDVLHDVGASLVPSIDVGQVEGGFIQGLGWLTCEEVLFDAKGRLITHSPDTYKIPAVGDAPEDFRVALLERAPQDNTVHGSKAVGEPPFMLAIGAVTALRHAVSAFGPSGTPVTLASPATPEALLRAVETARTGR
ncbi:xanthine dehydrogenase molybdopterin binding subunit [Melittangium boletus]|uniref:Xanthine dehydrogenase, molybdenum binding subunit n=1 Tax=Melittangium boletus DSM 14713 TaxID=1294270 RepID=A0A250IKH1_9BACT|nr:xanthine dehydrogenase molybdopterin binding subunit [Melittangium boletus]ATB31691.1 Xanthine dehydrogenase, molybdenum binding subunit [Melittangium boletus DSM 14713]